jgi:hypothetical protein
MGNHIGVSLPPPKEENITMGGSMNWLFYFDDMELFFDDMDFFVDDMV